MNFPNAMDRGHNQAVEQHYPYRLFPGISYALEQGLGHVFKPVPRATGQRGLGHADHVVAGRHKGDPQRKADDQDADNIDQVVQVIGKDFSSTISDASVNHAAFNILELDDGEPDDNGHENHGLGSRSPGQADESIIVNLVHQNLGGLGRRSARHGMNNAEVSKNAYTMFTTSKKGGGGQQRDTMVQNLRNRPARPWLPLLSGTGNGLALHYRQ